MDITGRWRKVPAQDDTDWLMLPYGARGLYLQLWRKLDNGGRLSLGKHGLRGVCAHVGTLADWPAIEPDLKALTDAGAVLFDAVTGTLEIPGFVDAQGAYVVSREAEKKRGQRARGKGQDGDMSPATGDSAGTNHIEENRREVEEKNPPLPPQSGGAHEKSSHPTESQGGDTPQAKQAPAVPPATESAQPPVLPGIPAQPNEPGKPPKSNRKRDRDRAAWDRATLTATTLLGELSQAIQRVRPGARPLRPTPSNLEQITGRLLEDNTVDDIRHVIKVCEARAKHSAEALSYFDAVTPFRKQNLGMWLAKTVEDSARDGPKPSWKADPTIGTDRGLPSEEDYKRWNG